MYIWIVCAGQGCDWGQERGKAGDPRWGDYREQGTWQLQTLVYAIAPEKSMNNIFSCLQWFTTGMGIYCHQTSALHKKIWFKLYFELLSLTHPVGCLDNSMSQQARLIRTCEKIWLVEIGVLLETPTHCEPFYFQLDIVRSFVHIVFSPTSQLQANLLQGVNLGFEISLFLMK